MGAVTPEFIHKLDENISTIVENEYANAAASLWWDKLMRVRPSQSKAEQINFLITSARIERTQTEGEVPFEDISMKSYLVENQFSAKGLKLSRSELLDLDGGGVDLATEWSAQIASSMAIFPQQELAATLALAESSAVQSYDGVPFFGSTHPVHPMDSSKGTYSNLLTGAASGNYPGAVPIGGSDMAVNLANLNKAVAYIKTIKSADGVTPRYLKPVGLLVPPQLAANAALLTGSGMLPLIAGGVGASADVSVLNYRGIFGDPIVADELVDDPTSYYIITSASNLQLSGFIWQEREPFFLTNHDHFSDAEIARTMEFQWIVRGRSAVAAGHPFAIFKCKAT